MKQINVYEFQELSEEIQKQVIERERNNHIVFMDTWLDGWKEELQQKGFRDCEIQYSLSWSQGDGVSFSCDNFDIKEFLKQFNFKESINNMLLEYGCIEIKGNKGPYSFASMDQVDFYLDSNKLPENTPNIDNIFETVLKELERLYINTCSELELSGYKEIEYQLSDEQCAERIKHNETWFTEQGIIVN